MFILLFWTTFAKIVLWFDHPLISYSYSLLPMILIAICSTDICFVFSLDCDYDFDYLLFLSFQSPLLSVTQFSFIFSFPSFSIIILFWLLILPINSLFLFSPSILIVCWWLILLMIPLDVIQYDWFIYSLDFIYSFFCVDSNLFFLALILSVIFLSTLAFAESGSYQPLTWFFSSFLLSLFLLFFSPLYFLLSSPISYTLS